MQIESNISICSMAAPRDRCANGIYSVIPAAESFPLQRKTSINSPRRLGKKLIAERTSVLISANICFARGGAERLKL